MNRCAKLNNFCVFFSHTEIFQCTCIYLCFNFSLFFFFLDKLQSDSVQTGIANGLDTIENGESNYGDQIYVKQSLPQISNEISIPSSYEVNANQNQRNLSEETSERNEQSAIEIPISTEDDDSQPQAHNCNINYTNESSICNGTSTSNSNNYNNAHTGNNIGHAIIDVVNTTHTSNDHAKVIIKAPEQLPYKNPTTTTTPPSPAAAVIQSSPSPHNNIHKINNTTTEYGNNDVDVNSNASGPVEESNRKHKLSNLVVLLHRSKPIALVVINSVLAVLIATSLCISMGLDYTVPAIVVGLIAVVASSGLWYWLYIAAITAPRDIRYVLKIHHQTDLWCSVCVSKGKNLLFLIWIEFHGKFLSEKKNQNLFFVSMFSFELCCKRT